MLIQFQASHRYRPSRSFSKRGLLLRRLGNYTAYLDMERASLEGEVGEIQRNRDRERHSPCSSGSCFYLDGSMGGQVF